MSISNTWIGDAKFARDIDEHPKQAGYAFRNAANDTVFEIMRESKSIFSAEFTERNKFTQRGIQFDRAKIPTMEGVEAIVGGKLNRPWLKEQHEGFKSDSAQATEMIRTSGSYKRAVRKKNYLSGAYIRRRMDTQNKANTIRGKAKATLAISYRDNYAMQGSNEFIQFGKGELFPGNESGLYQFVKGGEYYDNLGYGKIALAYRFDNKRSIKATPWLEKAIKKKGTPEQIFKRFEDQLRRQVAKFK